MQRNVLRPLASLALASALFLVGCDELSVPPSYEFTGEIYGRNVEFKRSRIRIGKFEVVGPASYMMVRGQDRTFMYINDNNDLEVDEVKQFDSRGRVIIGPYKHGKRTALTAASMLFSWYIENVARGNRQKFATIDNDPNYEWTLPFVLGLLEDLSSHVEGPPPKKLKLEGPFIREE